MREYAFLNPNGRIDQTVTRVVKDIIGSPSARSCVLEHMGVSKPRAPGQFIIKQLAKSCRVSTTTFNYWMNGTVKPPHEAYWTLRGVSKVYG